MKMTHKMIVIMWIIIASINLFAMAREIMEKDWTTALLYALIVMLCVGMLLEHTIIGMQSQMIDMLLEQTQEERK